MRLICTSSFSGLHRAIHRISCFRLFAKLFAQKVSLYILLCLSVSSIGTQIWHVMTNVKWENETSRDFRAPPVIKQGGKNSPDLKKYIYRRFSCNPCRRIRILLFHWQKKSIEFVKNMSDTLSHLSWHQSSPFYVVECFE